MIARRHLGLIFLVIGGLAAGLTGGGFWLLQGASAPTSTAYASIAILVLLGTVLAAWWAVDRLVLKPMAGLAAETRLIVHGTEQARIPVERFAALGALPESINLLAEKLFDARRRVEEAVADSTLRVEEQKSRLAAVLNDLHDGVLVCNLQHQILLYNRSALDLLRAGGSLGLGRSLFKYVASDPVLHTLERLHRARGAGDDRPAERHAPVLTISAEGQVLLRGQMGLVASGEQVTGYVITLADTTAETATMSRCDALLREATQNLRPPLAALLAAAETLADHPDLPAEQRAEFERVVLEQAQTLSTRLATVAADYQDIAGHLWPMDDLSAMDLIGLVAYRAAPAGCTVTMTGLPQRLRGESHSLVILLGRLIERLHQHLGVASFEMSVELADRHVYLDASWEGAPVPIRMLSEWGHDRLEALGGITVADVLQRHDSELWSEPQGAGRARLRIPLPLPARPRASVAPAPSRPEFFDFDLLQQPIPTGALGSTPLGQLSYVVFDTETTGLNPSGGDALLSIAGVRIVNGRILTGEAFDALINPGRPIPEASTRFHGIVDDMVRESPPAEVVLRNFKAFVADAVLVAHNASFDLKFLKLKEPAAGVRFDNPVLDTLVLSRFLQHDAGQHSLDALAQRLGLPIVDRHSALGDAVVTAALFLRFVDMLKERGVVTLDDAIRRSNMLIELQLRERAF